MFRYRSPEHWVEVFRTFYGPVHKAFAAIGPNEQAALEAHAKLNQSRPPLPDGLRSGAGAREDYEYNRTR